MSASSWRALEEAARILRAGPGALVIFSIWPASLLKRLARCTRMSCFGFFAEAEREAIDAKGGLHRALKVGIVDRDAEAPQFQNGLRQTAGKARRRFRKGQITSSAPAKCH